MTHQELRRLILDAIYRHQESAPKSYGLTEMQLAKQLGVDLVFDIEKGWLVRRGVYLKLTAAGIDEVERTE